MNIAFQDKNLAIIEKSAGMLVHPTIEKKNIQNKRSRTTIVDLITKKYPEIKKKSWPDPSRAGIVHRLDQDTSGLLIIAKNPQTLLYLQDQFRNHQIEKKYLALVLGKVTPEKGEIITQISREKGDTVRQKISSFSFSWDKKSKQAISYYKTIRNFTYIFQLTSYNLSLLEVQIKTGRMHQIRAQLKYKNWPIIGDQIYNNKESKYISDKLGLHRQFLHAYKLKIKLPDSTTKQFQSEISDDLQEVINKLQYNEEYK